MLRSPKHPSSTEPEATPQKTRREDDPGGIWVNNSEQILTKIKKLYDDREMSDVNLVVGDKRYMAHRLILCASSDVFQAMLMKPEWTEWHESSVELCEDPQCATVFSEFLEYFYTGQININNDNVMALLTLADKYNVESLSKNCVSYMCDHIARAPSQNQLILWLQYTMAIGHGRVAEACRNYIKWNLEAIVETADFENFETEVFASLLQQNDLVIHDELTLFTHVVRWVRLQMSRLGDGVLESDANHYEEQLVEQVMKYIRFPMMTPRQLADLLLSPLVVKYKEFFVERMAIGMSYHSGQEKRVEELSSTDEGKLLFTPRLYTSDTWSTLLSIDNFSMFPIYNSRTFVFSSRASLADHEGDRNCEWAVDLYPRGVWFRKFFLIVWQGTLEVPEYIIPTVRLSVCCRDPPEPVPCGRKFVNLTWIPDMRVKVGILMYGMQAGIEHVKNVKERVHDFSLNSPVLNIDDLISFDELNPPASSAADPGGSNFLVGHSRDQLKLHIIITPLTNNCSLSNPDFIFK